MRILLVRHGLTHGNRDNIALGQSDSPLTQEGLAASRDLAPKICCEPIHRVCSSDLPRALTTARIFAEAVGAVVEPRSEMRELSAGDWEGRPRLTCAGSLFSLRGNWHFQPPGGESYAHGERRLAPFIEALREYSDTVLVVGHASINRVFLKLWLDLSEETAMSIVFPHHAAYIIDDGSVRLLFNDGAAQEGLLRQVDR